jgi:hypothetical protein
MTTRFPLAPNDSTGVPTVITAPDTIDPSILPTSGGVSSFAIDGGSPTTVYAGTLKIDFGGPS